MYGWAAILDGRVGIVAVSSHGPAKFEQTGAWAVNRPSMTGTVVMFGFSGRTRTLGCIPMALR